MAFEILRGISHIEIVAVRDFLAAAISQSGSPTLSHVVVFGQIGYLFELLLLGTTTIVMSTIGVLRCFGQNPFSLGTDGLDKEDDSPDDQRQMRREGASERELEVTIRLEDGFLRTLHRHRCIVTTRELSGDAQNRGREVWYARDER